jgi:hypothetical protein
MERLKAILVETVGLLNKELNNYKKTGRINYQKVSTILTIKGNSLLVMGRAVEYEQISERNTMKLKLTRSMRAKLIQAAAMLLADATDGTLDAAEQTATLLESLAKEIREQNQG